MFPSPPFFFFFFFNDTATTEIYTLSLHDALPICRIRQGRVRRHRARHRPRPRRGPRDRSLRSEEHTSELQSRSDLVCRLLLEKKKNESINIWVVARCILMRIFIYSPSYPLVFRAL